MNLLQWFLDLFKPKPTPPPPPAPPRAAVTDDFNGLANAAPNSAIWSYHLAASGGAGMTDYIRNASLDGKGNLIIRAIRERVTDSRIPGVTVDYTSAAIHTKGKLEAQYGTWSARIQFPGGRGNHPTFALFGRTFASQADWPACGEIDVMEIQDTMQGFSLNGPGYDWVHGTQVAVRAPADMRGQFHVYAVKHEVNKVTISIDGKVARVFTPADLPKGTAWVLNQPVFAWLQLDLGSGMNAPAGQLFPQDMVVDWFKYEPLA